MAALPAPSSGVVHTDELVLRAAVSAYLGRYRGETRLHTESDLRVFLCWCHRPGPRPARSGPGGHRTVSALAAGRPLLPALDRLAAPVGRGGLLPGVRDRPDPAALTSRLRAPTDRAG